MFDAPPGMARLSHVLAFMLLGACQRVPRGDGDSASDGSISDEHDYGFPTPDDVITWFQRKGALEDLVDRRDAIVAKAQAIDAALAAAIVPAMDNEDPGDSIGLPGEAVQDAWESMTDDEREEVLDPREMQLHRRQGERAFFGECHGCASSPGSVGRPRAGRSVCRAWR